MPTYWVLARVAFERKVFLRQPKWHRPRMRSRSISILHQVPKVGLRPTRVLPDRILSPVLLITGVKLSQGSNSVFGF